MVWLLLTSGRGPVECQVAITNLVKIIPEEAKSLDVEIKILETESGDYGLLSALIALDGDNAEAFANSWKGTVKWVCQSPIRKEHKRKNWFVGVNVLTPPEQAATINENDLRYETMRASGPGGQNVQKTDSKIRLTHTPTGIIVTAQEERSQYRNKALALARLHEAILKQNQQAEIKVDQDKWNEHNNLVRGDAIRIYTGLDFKRVMK